jgi:hypothetical protein
VYRIKKLKNSQGPTKEKSVEPYIKVKKSKDIPVTGHGGP